MPSVGATKGNPLLAGGSASAGDLEAIARLGESRRRLKEQIARVIVGQEHVVDDLLTALKQASDPYGNGYDAESCRRLTSNVVAYALQK